MRLERGKVWDDRRIKTARTMLASGYSREDVAARLGINRVALRDAIHRLKLEPPRPSK